MPIVGFGDGTMAHIFQRSMPIPGAGRMEVGCWTQGVTTTLQIPTTLQRVYWGYAVCDTTKMGFPSIINGNACLTTHTTFGNVVDFCHSANTASGMIWNYMLFGD